MKDINYMNYFFTGIPLLLIGLGWLLDSDIEIVGMLLTMLTGFFQVVVGVMIFVDSGYRDSRYAFYLCGVTAFFVLWAFVAETWIIALPPILALYLSVLLYTDSKKQTK